MNRYQYAPDPYRGKDLIQYMNDIRKVVRFCNLYHGWDGNLMCYFDEKRNPGVKAKVLSAIPSVEIHGGELMGCTTVKLREPLTGPEMSDLQDYLKGQLSDGWGESFEQQEIQTGDGILFVHFGETEPFSFEVEQEQPVPKRPKMKLVGQHGNIFAILGKASRLLEENGQPEQAKEMLGRVQQSGNYYKALNIISEYMETELSGIPASNVKKGRDNTR